MLANITSSTNHPAVPMKSAQPLPPDDVLIGLAALLLDRLWKEQLQADGMGDRIEVDLLNLTGRHRTIS